MDKPASDLAARLLNTVPSIKTLTIELCSSLDIPRMHNLFESIQRSKWLTKLVLHPRTALPDVWKHLIGIVGANESLTTLTLQGYMLLKEVVDILPETLAQNKSIKKLIIDFYHEDMAPEDWIQLENAISNNGRLEELTVSIDKKVDTGFELLPIYKGMRKNKTIKNLTISDPSLSDDIFPVLCEGLANNQNVSQFTFEIWQASPEKFQKVLEIIKNRNNSIILTFNGVKMAHEGSFNEFLELIDKNLVAELHLNGYAFRGDSFMKRFFNSLKKNTSIQKITFDEVTWDTDQPRYIANYLESAKQLKSVALIGDELVNETSLLWLLSGINKSNLETVDFGNILTLLNRSDLVFERLAKHKTMKTLKGDFGLDFLSDPDNSALYDFLATNETVTSLILDPEQDLPEETSNKLLAALENNWTITKFGDLLRGKHSSIIRRNRMFYSEVRASTIILATNIARSEAAQNLLPCEVWGAIFGFISYPGLGSCTNLVRNIL